MRKALLLTIGLVLVIPVGANAKLPPLHVGARSPVYDIAKWRSVKIGATWTAVPRTQVIPQPCEMGAPCDPRNQPAATDPGGEGGGGCDTAYNPPNAESCHGWWFQRDDDWYDHSWNDLEFHTHFRVTFWTNSADTVVTHASVECSYIEGRAHWDRSSGHETCWWDVGALSRHETSFNVYWQFFRAPFDACWSKFGGIHWRVHAGGTVNAERQVNGFAYDIKSWETSCG